MKRPWLSTMIMLSIKWIFFYHWTKSGASHYFKACRSPPRFPSMNLMQHGKSQIPLVKLTLSLTIDHWISFAIASLMHDEMNTTSSQIKVFDQFHMNVSCMVTLSCLKYSVKFKRHCFSFNLHVQPESLQTSLVNLAWLMIFGTTSVTNSWNLAKVSSSRF
jgi:hypothetical protein